MTRAERKKLVTRFARAAERGEVDVLREMLDADPTLANAGSPRRPLWLAARHGHRLAAEILLVAGADPGDVCWETTRCALPETPLEAAGRAGHADVVALLRPLDAMDLATACALGDVVRVLTILEANPDELNAARPRDADGRFSVTALAYAAFAGRADLVDLLLDRGAKPRVGLHPLDLALGTGNLWIARRLVDAGDVPDTAERIATSFSLAAYGGKHGAIDLLLGLGLDIDARRPDEEHCAFVMVRHPTFDALVMLLDAGAPLDAQRRNGKTMLHLAASMGLTRFAAELLDRGADTTILDDQGMTALDYAKKRKNPKMAEYLAAREKGV